MKSVLATVLLFGLFLAVDSVCNINSCPALTTKSCSTATTYLDCLTQQLSKCGNGNDTLLQSVVKSLQLTKASLRCGLVLAVDSVCNIDSCPVPSTRTCSTGTTYLNCLRRLISGCDDDSTKAIIESTITKVQQQMQLHLGCSGGSGASGGGAMITLSISVFSLLAFYLKL